LRAALQTLQRVCQLSVLQEIVQCCCCILLLLLLLLVVVVSCCSILGRVLIRLLLLLLLAAPAVTPAAHCRCCISVGVRLLPLLLGGRALAA
jgi:hypothetical protein